MEPSGKSYWLKSGFYTIMERVSVLLFGLGSLLILFRAFSEDKMGTWVLFLAVTTLLEVGRAGLQQNALVKHLTVSKDEEYGRICTASLFNIVALSVLIVLFLIACAHPMSVFWKEPELKTLFYIYTITTIALIPMYQSNFTQQANLDFRGIFWSAVVKQGLFFFYILFCFLSGIEITLISLALVQIVGAVSGSIVSLICGKAYLRFSKVLDWNWVKKLFHFGKYVFGTNLSTMLYKRIDVMMIGSLLSAAFVAIYEITIRITNLAEQPAFSVAAIVFPQSAKTNEEEGTDATRKLYERSVGAILALILPIIIFVLLFPEFTLSIIGGSKYTEYAYLLRITMLFGLFVPFAIQFGTILDSIGKPKINFYFTLLGAAINVALNYLFITKFGIVGAAYGTLTTYAIMFVIMQTVLYKLLNVKFYNVFPNIFQFYSIGINFGYDFIKKRKAAANANT